MIYLGGKSRSAKAIAPFLTRHAGPGVAYREPFLGGASVAAITAPIFYRAILSDIHAELIEMWCAAAWCGWRPPTEVTEDEYRTLREGPRSPLRTYVGFAASFGGKWWGGYAQESAGAVYVRPRDGYRYPPRLAAGSRVLVERARAIGRASVSLVAASYEIFPPARAGDVIYCDPPYADSTGYAGLPEFDHSAFWAWAEQQTEHGAFVYVSEFHAPPGWVMVWSRAHRNEMRRATARTDGLFVHESTMVGAA